MAGSSSKFVSCIMATRDRRRFIPQALRCFLRQTHENSELIVVDDGRESVADLCVGLPRVRHIQLYRPVPTGTKLNIGIQRARGDILQKLDDDDYYHPDFLQLAMAPLPSRACAQTLVAWDCFMVLFAGEANVRHSGHGWQVGGTFCFYRKLWQRRPFRDVAKDEDFWFLNDHLPQVRPVCAAEQYIVVRHGRNTWHSLTDQNVDSYFRALPPYRKPLAALVPPEDLVFYQSLSFPASSRPQPGRPQQGRVAGSVIIGS